MWQNFKDFMAQPYSDSMDAKQWFAFLGLLIVLTALWAIILKHLKEALT